MEAVKARLASGNSHKLDELRAALPGWEIELLGRGPFPEETGETYYENALAKARFGRQVGDADAWMLGEDSGIEVAALGGAPGIASARWADDGVAALLTRLDGVDERHARYVCELVGLGPAGEERRGTGILEGAIATERTRRRGFRLRPDLHPGGRVEDGRGARRRLEAGQLPPSPAAAALLAQFPA